MTILYHTYARCGRHLFTNTEYCIRISQFFSFSLSIRPSIKFISGNKAHKNRQTQKHRKQRQAENKLLKYANNSIQSQIQCKHEIVIQMEK